MSLKPLSFKEIANLVTKGDNRITQEDAEEARRLGYSFVIADMSERVFNYENARFSLVNFLKQDGCSNKEIKAILEKCDDNWREKTHESSVIRIEKMRRSQKNVGKNLSR